MDPWLIWLVAAFAMTIAESLTLTVVLGLLGGAAALTAVFAAIGLPLPLQPLIFSAAATTAVLLARPALSRRLYRPDTTLFGIDALVGQPGYVLDQVTNLSGRVRISGEEWSARAFDDTAIIPTGTTVDVMAITGSTAIVYPREGPCRSQLN
jgi:membrane protein implicated in regulation of membrane protease activity